MEQRKSSGGLEIFWRKFDSSSSAENHDCLNMGCCELFPQKKNLYGRDEMDKGQTVTHGEVWQEYLDQFHGGDMSGLRSGNFPRTYRYAQPTGKSLVLIHGLTDSPYCMDGLARFFHFELGYSVYMPLLQGHGLISPGNMEDVRLDTWRENVTFSCEAATANGDRMSIGGLSTGGALAFDVASRGVFNENLYLFSAALGLYAPLFSGLGRVVEWLLRSPLARLIPEKQGPLVGDNPGRYDRVPYCAATELCILIGELMERIEGGRDRLGSAEFRLFFAYSECDKVISIERLKKLARILGEKRCSSFVLPRSLEVEHACVVLEKAVRSTRNEAILEEANPRFREMVDVIRQFEQK